MKLPRRRTVVAALALTLVAVPFASTAGAQRAPGALPTAVSPQPTPTPGGVSGLEFVPGRRPMLNGKEAPAYVPNAEADKLREEARAKLGALTPPADLPPPVPGQAPGTEVVIPTRSDVGISMREHTQGKRTNVAGKMVQLPADAWVEGPVMALRSGVIGDDGKMIPVVNGKPDPNAPYQETMMIAVRQGDVTAYVGTHTRRVVATTPKGNESRFGWLNTELSR